MAKSVDNAKILLNKNLLINLINKNWIFLWIFRVVFLLYFQIWYIKIY